MKNYFVAIVSLIICNASLAGENCGIDEKYLEGIGFVLYGISELSEKNNTAPINTGSLVFSWNLACENEEFETPEECGTGNCDHRCGAMRKINESGKPALILASQLSSNRSGEVVVVGWANSNKLDECTGLPYISARLYVPGYKILNIEMGASGTSKVCQNGF